MIRLVWILSMLILPLFASSQPVSIDYARNQYFTMSSKNCYSLDLSERFEKNPPKTAVLKSYYGAATAAAPECVGNPATKLSLFKKGRKLLDEAVKEDPSNFEVRFLRFATQDKAPSFLGYNDNLEDDKKVMLNGLKNASIKYGNASFFNEMLKFLMKSESLNQKEKLIVKEYLPNISN